MSESRNEILERARREAAVRNARDFGTDPSWYGQEPEPEPEPKGSLEGFYRWIMTGKES